MLKKKNEKKIVKSETRNRARDKETNKWMMDGYKDTQMIKSRFID